MWMLNCRFCDFVVFTPTKTTIERFAYEPQYVEEFLLPAMQRFYFGKYLPRVVAKERGLLREDGEARCAVERLDLTDYVDHAQSRTFPAASNAPGTAPGGQGF
jgi:hypothetical protein